MTTGDSQALIRTAAFRLLLAHARPIEPDELATVTGTRTDRVPALLAELDRAGRIRRDGTGRVVGAAGLSVIPDRHQIEIDGRRFWTWCAYDILGIFGALAANGHAVSPSPDGATVVVVFEGGRPQNHSAVLFRPDDDLLDGCENVYEEWCPNSNLFLSRRQATLWADVRSIPGWVMGLEEASELGTRDWVDVVQRQGQMPGEVDREELRRMVEAGAQLVEVLPEEEYAEDHLPRAISLPLRRLDDEASTTLDRNRPVIVYCWDSA